MPTICFTCKYPCNIKWRWHRDHECGERVTCCRRAFVKCCKSTQKMKQLLLTRQRTNSMQFIKASRFDVPSYFSCLPWRIKHKPRCCITHRANIVPCTVQAVYNASPQNCWTALQQKHVCAMPVHVQNTLSKRPGLSHSCNVQTGCSAIPPLCAAATLANLSKRSFSRPQWCSASHDNIEWCVLWGS